MAQTADEIAADIARTRASMSNTLGAIGDQMSPKQVVRRSTHRMKQFVHSARDGVMGSASGEGSVALQSGAGPDAIAGPAPGNPLAAGIIAFGAGLLVGSLLPATKVEQHAASALADMTDPAIGSMKQAASEVVHGVQESAAHVAGTLGGALKDVGDEVVDLTQP